MGDFKQQFNNTFKEAPSFSMQARKRVKQQIYEKKQRRYLRISIVAVAVVAALAFFGFNSGLFKEQGPVNLAAPEHPDKLEIFEEVDLNHETQFAISNTMNSMSRGKGEYVGYLGIETQFDDVEYGQVVLLEEGRIDDAFQYVLGRVIGKSGDTVAIVDGQLYVNDLPITAFYGKALVMGTTDVEEAFERLQLVQSTEWKETIEEALSTTVEPITLAEDEVFIVSDNWSRNSVRQVYSMEQVEGVVLGYTLHNSALGWRMMKDVELATLKTVSAEIFDGIRAKDKNVYEKVSIEHFSVPHPHGGVEMIFEIQPRNVSDEIVDHSISYYPYAYIGNSKIVYNKAASLTYKMTDSERLLNLYFVFVQNEWKLSGFDYN